ncbi:MAG TPA: S8 family peptidase [Kiloniellales bacterium]|nr:S8 family peptidase [Kiloniellales bacterium]
METRNSLFRETLYASVAVSLALAGSAQAAVDAAPAAARPSTLEEATVPASFQMPDDLYLEKIEEQMAESPQEAEAIAAQAKEQRPHLSDSIDALVEEHLATHPDAPTRTPPPAQKSAILEGMASASSSAALNVPGLAIVAGGALAVLASGNLGSDKKAFRESPDPEPEEPAPPPFPPAPVPEDFESPEYQASWGLAAVGASHAYAAGLTGKGVKVAIIDTGIDLEHPEFTGQLLDPYDAVLDSSELPGLGIHGTTVAGLIGAAKDDVGMHGVAYESIMIPISMVKDGYMDFGPDGLYLARAVNHAIEGGASVINNSYGGYFGSLEDILNDYLMVAESFQDIIDNEIIFVAFFGNLEEAAPFWPAVAPEHNEDWKGNWIAVGALDKDGQAARYSNICGAAADWCLFAPGDETLTTAWPGGYAYTSGTSMAAPMVSGGVALLRQAFPYLKASEITSILFETADDMGNKEKYGHGRMNLERAFAPIGQLSIPVGKSVNDKNLSLNGSSLVVSAAFGDGIAEALRGHSLIGLDGYKRSFEIDMGNFVKKTRQDSRKDALHRLKLFGGIEERSVRTVTTGPFSITTADRLEITDPSMGSTAYSRMTFAFVGAGYTAEISMNPDLGRAFGFRQTGFASAPLIQGHGFDQPHLTLMETGFGSAAGLDLDATSTLRIAVYSGNVEARQATLLNDVPTMHGAVAELERRSTSFIVRGSVGVISEEGSLLGSLSRGAFGEDLRTTTFFANLGTTIDVTPRTKLTLAGALGQSAFKQNSGLMRRGEKLVTSAFGVGLSRREFLQEDDIFSLAAGQPMRVESGKVTLSLPVSRDMNGGIHYRKVGLNPQPSGRELNLQATYGFEVMEGVSTSIGAMQRFNANHVAGQSETLGMMSLSFAF